MQSVTAPVRPPELIPAVVDAARVLRSVSPLRSAEISNERAQQLHLSSTELMEEISQWNGAEELVDFQNKIPCAELQQRNNIRKKTEAI